MSTQPTPHFQLSDGKEIKMYFGLLNRLAKLIGGFNTVALVLTDINVQEEIIKNLRGGGGVRPSANAICA